jgi:manganese transport protein
VTGDARPPQGTAELGTPTPESDVNRGWRRERTSPSLSEVHRSVAVPSRAPAWRKFLAFAGPGYLVAVGYMDPGNWATDISGGAQFAYRLLFVIMLSNLMAILLQALAAKLGIVTGRDLAQACRDHYKPPVVLFHWLLCEVAIAACDLAEVIGAAIALKLLFGIPLLVGLCLTALDVLLVLFLQQRGFRLVEALVVALIATIGVCFLVEILLSRPSASAIARGFLPSAEILRNPEMLYIAIGILGATVMPHNLYLHSSIVQTRAFEHTPEGRREAIRWATIDSSIALMLALFVNAAILITAAAAFYGTGHRTVGEIQDAYTLLSPILGTSIASTLFALALLCSGQNATLTGTLAGQIVMEGFLQIRLAPWLRRLITRLIAIVPSVIVVGLYGERQTGPLLVLSQVILSLQLSFAVVPLVQFTSERAKMGEFVNPVWLRVLAWSVAVLIGALNFWLLIQSVNHLLLTALAVGGILFALFVHRGELHVWWRRVAARPSRCYNDR